MYPLMEYFAVLPRYSVEPLLPSPQPAAPPCCFSRQAACAHVARTAQAQQAEADESREKWRLKYREERKKGGLQDGPRALPMPSMVALKNLAC